MKTIKAIMLPAITLLLGMSLLSACNTVQGFGKDMQQGGQQLQKAANDSKGS